MENLRILNAERYEVDCGLLLLAVYLDGTSILGRMQGLPVSPQTHV